MKKEFDVFVDSRMEHAEKKLKVNKEMKLALSEYDKKYKTMIEKFSDEDMNLVEEFIETVNARYYVERKFMYKSGFNDAKLFLLKNIDII